MKLTAILLLSACIGVQAAGNAQNVSLSEKNATLIKVIESIKKQSGYKFLYKDEVIKKSGKVDVEMQNTPLEKALEKVFQNQPIEYKIIDRTIVLKLKETTLITEGLKAGLPVEASPVPINVHGVVKDETGKPAEGVVIKIKGTTSGTVTNANGEFSLSNVDENSVLVFSSINLRTAEIKVRGQRLINIELKEMVPLKLQEVVAVGYGTQSRNRLTNSISKINAEVLDPEKNIVSDISKALQGRVPGLFIATTAGTPNSSVQIQIRGVQTAQAILANPLFVVDGLIIENNTLSLNNINPQDIESVEVLKDAASAAIYGARGSTGVIIITTKKGKPNSKPVINVTSYLGYNNVPTNRGVLDTDDYKSAFTESRQNRINDINAQLAAGGLTAAQIGQLTAEKTTLGNAITNLTMANSSIDWVDRIKNKNALQNNLQVNMRGGTDKTQYFMSAGHYGEENAIGTGHFDRYSGRLDLIQKVNDWLRLGGNLSFTRNISKGYTYPLVAALQARPDTPEKPVLNANGSYGYYVGSQQHPLGVMADDNNISKQNNITGTFTLDATFTKNLSSRSLIAGNQAAGNSYSYSSPFTYNGSFNNGIGSVRSTEGFNYNIDNYFTYNGKWKKLGATATLGQSFYSTEQRGYGYDLQGFPTAAGIYGPGAASSYGSVFNIASNNSYYKEYSESYFLRSNFDWEGKYLLNAAIRTDGSSKLVKENRYSWFPSLSAGWVVSKETFLKEIHSIDYLKIRTSYGQTGNIRPLGLFDAQNILTAGSYLGAPALLISGTIGNDQVKWEKTTQYDAGIDLTLLKNRLNITFDIYQKKTEGLLTSNFTPWSTGYTSKKDNIGTIQNSGYEIEVTYNSNRSREFKWNVSANIGVNSNKVLSLRDSVMSYGTFIFGGPQSQVKVGQAVGSVLVLNSLGVDPKTGDMIYQDLNKDGGINSKDNINVPIALPKFSGGFTTDLSYKGFDLSALFTFVYGNKIYDYYEQTMREYNVDFYGVMPNKFDIVNSRWRKPGDITDVPRAIAGVHGPQQTSNWNFQPSTQFIYDASYLRLRNLAVGYNIPKRLISKLNIAKARVYIAAQNLFTITKYIGFDPETASNSGIVSSNTPQARSVVFGINFSL